MKFSIKDFFSKCDQIRSFLRIWSHLLKKYFMENFIFWAVFLWKFREQKSSSRQDEFDYFRNLFGSNVTLLPCIITIEISFFRRFCLFCLYLAPEIINKVTTLLLNDINNSSLFHTMPLWQSTYYLCSNDGTSPTGGRLEKDKNSYINYEKVKPLLFCLKKII